MLHDLVKDEKIMIEDLELLGYARLSLLPLLDKHPFIGGFQISFNEKLIFLSDLNKINKTSLVGDYIDQKINQILANPSYKISVCFLDDKQFNKAIYQGNLYSDFQIK